MKSFFQHTWDLLMKGGMMAAGFLQGLNGDQNQGIFLLMALMVADYISGVASAALHRSPKTQQGGLSSDAGWRGLLKKALMLLVVLLSYVLDDFVGQGNAMFQTAVTWFYISNEGISLLENLALAGVPIPRKLRAALEKMAEEDGEPVRPEPQEKAAPTDGGSNG